MLGLKTCATTPGLTLIHASLEHMEILLSEPPRAEVHLWHASIVGKPGHVNASVVAVCGLDSFSHLWEVDSHSVDGKDHTHI